MKNKILIRIGITLAVLIVGGIAYWFQPYNQDTVLGINMWLIMSMGAIISSSLLTLFINEKSPKIALLVSLGVVLAVLARIIYDTTFWDSSSHNMAPFEIIICWITTVISAFVGVYLGLLIKKIKSRFNK